MKFSKLYEELKLLDICKPVSPEEAKKRDTDYGVIKLKERLGTVKKTKLPDGTWRVHQSLDVSKLKLTSLKDLNVSIIDGGFSCDNNKLTSLEGCPTKVGGYFNCANNKLTSLEGCPKEVEGYFNCSHNELSTLKGCPTKVKSDFSCANNKLTSLDGCPKEVENAFFCYNNSKKFTIADIQAVCDVKGHIEV